jgi:hypothetical protein
VKTIRELNAPPHVVGRVEAIIVRGKPRDPARRIDSTQALASGSAARRSSPRGKSR